MCIIWGSVGEECNELSFVACYSVQSGKCLQSSGEISILLYNKDDDSSFSFAISTHIFFETMSHPVRRQSEAPLMTEYNNTPLLIRGRTWKGVQ